MKKINNFISDVIACFITIGIIAFAILVFVAITKVCINVVFGATETSDAIIETEDYVVCDGDTLWSIATEYKQEKQDIREYVYQLRKLNNIDNCIIYPGQTIKIIK